MNTKKKIAVRKLLSGVLVLLGFTACDSDGPGNELCEYGTPSADYQVKGKVLDQTGKPIKGVQVVDRAVPSQGTGRGFSVYGCKR